MNRAHLIKNQETFTADTDYLPLQARNVKEVVLSLEYLQNGSTAPTLAEALGILNEVKILEGGDLFSAIKGVDLWALNLLMLNHYVRHVEPSADNGYGVIQGLRLPINKTADGLKIFVDHESNSKIDTEKLTVAVRHVDRTLNKPISLAYISDTATSTFKAFDISRKGKRLIGLLIYATTVEADSKTIEEIKVLVNTREIYWTHWDALETFNAVPFDTTEEGMLDNYKFISFVDEPFPADDLKVKLYGGAGDAFRLIGVYR